MVSRERLLHLGATMAERANRLRGRSAVRLAGRLLVVALVLLLALRLWQLWRRHPVDFGEVDGVVFAVAVVASVIAVTAYGLVWPFLLRRLGTRAPYSWITLFFKSQLGKYLPGSVWQYAGRVGLAHTRGVPMQRALASVVAEVSYSAIAAAAASSLVLGHVAAAGVLVGFAGLLALAVVFRPSVAAMLARVPLVRSSTRLDRTSLSAALRAGPASVGLYLIVSVLYGVAFWTTGRALFAIPASDLPRYIGVFALAWLAGLVAVFAPGGIGVREAVIVALLHSRLGEANAIVLAGASRIILTAIDLAAGAAAFGLPALRRSDARPVGADQ
jgi:hypothetical protein